MREMHGRKLGDTSAFTDLLDVNEVLQHGKDVWISSRFACERRVLRCCQLIQILPIISACIDQQRCEMLCVWMPLLNFAVR
jgi:hypothetical protein